MSKNIKSPLSKEISFETKVKRLFEDAKVEGAFVFYIPKEGDVCVMDVGLCGYELISLGESMIIRGEERLKTEDDHTL